MDFCAICGKHLSVEEKKNTTRSRGDFCGACQMSSITQISADSGKNGNHGVQNVIEWPDADDIKAKVECLQICRGGCGALVKLNTTCQSCNAFTGIESVVMALGFQITPVTAVQICEVCGRMVEWGMDCTTCLRLGHKRMSLSLTLSTAQGKEAEALEVCCSCGWLVGWGESCSRCSSQKTNRPSLRNSKMSEVKKMTDETSEERAPNSNEDVTAEIRVKWEREQNELKRRLIMKDDEVVMEMRYLVKNGNPNKTQYYIGGMDISFVKGDSVNACAALVVLSFPDLTLVYEDYMMIKLTAPYISGFLAFREAGFLINLFNKLKSNKPEYVPQVLFMDGNGLIHPREFGLACHLGVLLDIPCVGVAKTLLQTDGLEKNAAHASKVKQLKKGGDTFSLTGSSGRELGVALRSVDGASNPIFVSVGHRITLETAVSLVHQCCQYRIPEPVRLADLNSREYLRKQFP